MAKFLNYRNIEFNISGFNYYATKVSFSAKASVDAVILDNGQLLNYAPQGSVVGNLSVDFYLTGSLPNFFQITGIDESPINVRFATVAITGTYPKSIAFSVEPFQPILISADFDCYGNINVEDFKENTQADRDNYQISNYLANGYKSYLDNTDLDGVDSILSFDYNAGCDRPAFYKVDSKIPFRVAKLNKSANISLKSNKLGKLLDIYGKSVTSTITLKDLYGTTLNIFNISGILESQNYEVSEGQYLLSSAQITQTVVERKTLI